MLEKIIKRSLMVVSVLLAVVSFLTLVAGVLSPDTAQAVQNTPPVITVGWSVANYIVGHSFSTSTALSSATALDAQDGNITSQIQATGVDSVNTNVPGTYYITLSVIDSGGLTDTFVREINVRNQGEATPGRCYEQGDLNDVYTKCPPDITLLGANPMTVQLNVTFTDPGATSTDFEDGDLTAYIIRTGVVNTSATGTYPLVYNVVDSEGMSASTTRTVIVTTTPPVYQCSDTIDNDGDGNIDMQDPGCQDPTDDDENQPPILTLLGLNPMTVLLNATLTDPGATSTDPEDGDLTNQIIATGTVNTSATGTYPIVYSVSDSEGLTASTTRTVIVVSTSTPNQAPVITITGGANLEIFVGDTYNDRGATALDFEDGDITNSITATGTVNTAITGTYTIRYNVKDSQGLAAVEKIRTVVVKEQSGCGSNCGGGIYIPPTPTLTIFDEKVEPKSNNSALITWKTDASADSRVVYGASSISGTVVGFANYGYTNTTLTDNDLAMTHSILITGLLPNTNYYFKPVSDNPSVEPVLGKELALITGQPPVVPPVIPPVIPPVVAECNYLLEYLRIDLQNNPLEVIKLQSFLKNNEGFVNLAVNGVFDQATLSAVNTFQVKYGVDVLVPWGYMSNQPTGYVYITTKKKINELYCQRPFPLTFLQEQEIASSRALYEAMSQQGSQATTTTLPIIGQTEPGSGGGAVAEQPSEPIVIAEPEITQPEITQPETSQPEIGGELGIANITDISNIGESPAENQAGDVQKKGGLLSASIFSALPNAKTFLVLDLSLIAILVILAGFLVYLKRKRKQESEILVKGPNSSLLKNLPGIEGTALNLD